jgi:hypothetical protein
LRKFSVSPKRRVCFHCLLLALMLCCVLHPVVMSLTRILPMYTYDHNYSTFESVCVLTRMLNDMFFGWHKHFVRSNRRHVTTYMCLSVLIYGYVCHIETSNNSAQLESVRSISVRDWTNAYVCSVVKVTTALSVKAL